MERWSLLALLRCWLALIVAANHVVGFGTAAALVAFLPRLGSLEAILGFLVVSGCSIGMSYRSRPQGFVRRRAARLYPVYLLALVVTWLVTPQPLSWALAAELAANVLFLNQLVVWPSYVAAAWSLSLEAWLYALAPWLHRQTAPLLRWLMLGSLLFYAVQTVGRSLWHWPYYAWLGWGLNLPALAFAWLAGWAAAGALPQRTALRWLAALFAAHLLLAAALQCAYRVKHGDLHLIGGDLAGFALRGSTLVLTGWVLHQALKPTAATLPKRRLAHLLGNLSYPLYLLHIPVYEVLQRAGVADAETMLAAALAAAALANLAVEVTPACHGRALASWLGRWAAPPGRAPRAAPNEKNE